MNGVTIVSRSLDLEEIFNVATCMQEVHGSRIIQKAELCSVLRFQRWEHSRFCFFHSPKNLFIVKNIIKSVGKWLETRTVWKQRGAENEL